jgi:hypothetical protein
MCCSVSTIIADSSELEYTYDLQLPPQNDSEYVRPRPHDDEVESFAVSLVYFESWPLLNSSSYLSQRSSKHYTMESSSRIAD